MKIKIAVALIYIPPYKFKFGALPARREYFLGEGKGRHFAFGERVFTY